MENRNFMDLLTARMNQGLHVCVGLDPEYDQPKFPQALIAKHGNPISAFGEFISEIVSRTHSLAAAFKPNLAFYIRYGSRGLSLLHTIVQEIQVLSPEVPIILDAKFADIGNTNNGYVDFVFKQLGVDAVTLNPYLGQEALLPFLKHQNKGSFILCRTSNAGANEFQGFRRCNEDKLYGFVASQVYHYWNIEKNCGLVVGATAPDELRTVAAIVKGGLPILIPGVGAQGGDLEISVKAAIYDGKLNAIINSSRGVLYKSSGPDYAEAAAGEVARMNQVIYQALSENKGD